MVEKSKVTYALLIYRASGRQPAPADERRALEGHRALQGVAAARGELHAVARLDDATAAKTVSVQKGVHTVADGPYVETKEWLVGFYLLDCASEEEALARARTICPIADHAIEVRPVSWRWKP
jgi:hypothetical protein